nr:MAG TPA_asm: hypothetical protein [Caudoviricetes sp.]
MWQEVYLTLQMIRGAAAVMQSSFFVLYILYLVYLQKLN